MTADMNTITKMVGKKIMVSAAKFVILLLGVGYFMWYSFVPELTRVTIPLKNLPPSLEGFSILHLSDLHGARFGKGQVGIFKLLEDVRVDMVAFTGDLVDARRKEIEPGMELIKRAGDLAPVYFVPGNHEKASGVYPELKKMLRDRNVIVMGEGLEVSCTVGDSSITVIGVGVDGKTQRKDWNKIRVKGPVIMLSHYPRIFKRVAGRGVNLVLAGHTHGGQIRLPWVGALYIPGQGKFPYYDAGLFFREGTYLYINRGLGASGIPVRFMCRPEVAVITLTKGE